MKKEQENKVRLGNNYKYELHLSSLANKPAVLNEMLKILLICHFHSLCYNLCGSPFGYSIFLH